MINQNWWFTTLLIKQHKYCPPLNKAIKCDVLIGKPALFSLSNGWAKFYKVDTHRKPVEMKDEF